MTSLGIGLAAHVELARQHLLEQLAGFRRRCGGRTFRTALGGNAFTRFAPFATLAVAPAAPATARAVARLFVRSPGLAGLAGLGRCTGLIRGNRRGARRSACDRGFGSRRRHRDRRHRHLRACCDRLRRNLALRIDRSLHSVFGASKVAAESKPG